MVSIIDFNFTEQAGWRFLAPMILIVVDIVTGLLWAWSRKKFESSKMRTGLAKKFGEILILMVSEFFVAACGFPKEIVNFMVLYISYMEGMSIIENLARLGVPLPDKIKKALKQVTDDAVDNAAKKIGGKKDD